ncbi:MAG: hypothetical protein WC549_09040 [Actinomycetota bacterium]
MKKTNEILGEAFADAQKDVENIVKKYNLGDEIEKELSGKLKKAKEEAKKEAGSPFLWDEWIYRSAIIVLGSVIIIAIIGTIWLTLAGIKELPSILIALGSASVGAIAGILTPTGSKEKKE